MAPQRHQPQSSQALPRLPYSLSAPGLTQVPGGFVPAPRNTKTFDRNELVLALNHLSSLIAPTFQGQKVTLFAHGGAVMVLHLGLGARQTTRDVNVCLREFNKEWSFKGVENAENKLRWCIYQTARQRRLGADWMNSGSDAAIPWVIKYVIVFLFAVVTETDLGFEPSAELRPGSLLLPAG
ncbi:hypothetical protein NLI96_g12718 [Meripilus lineatus]|uniref:Uncharacterized protein n=1 Tax=Meripilus lineatus TaxID=2056292 RepID=A0AAD5UR33_9APHY|nr:hypothetical protein NLI96_g12718 [Physisporinus lineatus]